MKFEMVSGDERLFDGAPEWVVKIYLCLGYRWLADANGMASYAGGPAVELKGEDEKYLIAERRPITEQDVNEWNGEGLPPVGVECEFAHINRGEPIPPWERGVVRYLSSHTIVIELTGLKNGKAESISQPLRMRFRPIRSPAEVARDAAIHAMASAPRRCGHPLQGICGEIYDAIAAGKIPGVKLE
ncbi:hypothetical protein [Rouxiella sp. Mn2063]|uniref:hypothetical protein n=1 Tax=Rouxiella sp. Mn2063 TaxID=3395262 RepID=UPI003BE0FA76